MCELAASSSDRQTKVQTGLLNRVHYVCVRTCMCVQHMQIKASPASALKVVSILLAMASEKSTWRVKI